MHWVRLHTLIQIFIYTHKFIEIFIYTHTLIQIFIYTRTFLQILIYTHTLIQIFIYSTHTHKFLQICIYTHTRTYVHMYTVYLARLTDVLDGEAVLLVEVGDVVVGTQLNAAGRPDGGVVRVEEALLVGVDVLGTLLPRRTREEERVYPKSSNIYLLSRKEHQAFVGGRLILYIIS